MNPPPDYGPENKEARLSPGFPKAAYLPLVLFTSGLSVMGAPLSGCGVAGVTDGALTSGFGASAANVLGLVME